MREKACDREENFEDEGHNRREKDGGFRNEEDGEGVEKPGREEDGSDGDDDEVGEGRGERDGVEVPRDDGVEGNLSADGDEKREGDVSQIFSHEEGQRIEESREEEDHAGAGEEGELEAWVGEPAGAEDKDEEHCGEERVGDVVVAFHGKDEDEEEAHDDGAHDGRAAAADCEEDEKGGAEDDYGDPGVFLPYKAEREEEADENGDVHAGNDEDVDDAGVAEFLFNFLWDSDGFAEEHLVEDERVGFRQCGGDRATEFFAEAVSENKKREFARPAGDAEFPAVLHCEKARDSSELEVVFHAGVEEVERGAARGEGEAVGVAGQGGSVRVDG